MLGQGVLKHDVMTVTRMNDHISELTFTNLYLSKHNLLYYSESLGWMYLCV